VRKLIVTALLGALASTASAQQSSVMGTWLTASGKAQVRIGPCADPANGPICGFIAGLNDPKGPDGVAVSPEAATDFRNADPALRSRKILGMPLIWGFKKSSDPNAFEDGKIYSAENGKTYNAKITLQPDGKLSLRGYVGSPMFGETQIWTRIN
jgi:uncharacterized protein (DUF2147 family)